MCGNSHKNSKIVKKFRIIMEVKNVKRILAIAIALTLLLALAVPAMASDTASKDAVTSAVVIGGTGGSPPIVKCKWETSGTLADSENGDTGHLIPGTQVIPTINEGADTCQATVYYWAIVTDPQGKGDIREVAVDVFEPGVEPDYVFKYKVQMPQYLNSDWTGIKAALNAAHAAHLVTYAAGYTLQEIAGTNGEIDQAKCYLYRGSKVIAKPQAGGIYHVNAYAYDLGNEQAAFLINCFEYVRTAALVKDFTNVDWGEVKISTEQAVCGDADMLTPSLPTLKSAGNCNLAIAVTYSNLNRTSDNRPMDEVEFDAYLIDDGYRVGGILPGVKTDISGIGMPETQCKICTPTKLGLSIHVIQAPGGEYTGTVTLTGTDNLLPWAGAKCSNPACARGHG
jgi:hypothetical protein